MDWIIVLLAFLGWLYHALQKIRLAKVKHKERFTFIKYISGHVFDMIMGIVATTILLLVLPANEITRLFAFFIGYSAQAMIRDLLKRDNLKGII